MQTYKVVSTVTVPQPEGAEQKRVEVVRLVDAKTKKGAIAHVAHGTISAEVATTEDLLSLGAAGVKLETA